ncbi:MAG: nuclear transport factor 2 family protein, partial [Bacteroidetes bacterium]|nr:nuclear transport factor 2 family protein [Bacteroidota bacterium]
MKLNKTLETTILEAYHEYWDAYLKGDMQTMSYWLHDNIQMIGSGRGEFFDNKKKTIQYYKSTTKQVAGKADMRNRKITVQPVGNEILVNEECDFFVLINSVWTFYGEGRISTLFTKTNKGWKIIQEHGSMPDANTRKGEQVNTNKIKAENVRLKEAVKRRTIELEEKNSELEIETSLERVRTVAMAMKQPDDMLSVCKTISQQMQKLGIKEIRNIQTAIFYEERGSYMNYQFYAKHNKTFITDTVYSDHKIQKAFAAQMLKGKGKFYITHIKGEKKLKKFIAYQKSTNVFIDKHLYTASSLSYYWYSLGPVALGISTYLHLTVEDENLFKRFLNVFELTYRRYLDIEKAEAQAREAQIETSLERVRSRTMAMHQTSELQEVIHTVHKELLHLKLSIDGGSFIVINDDFEKGLRFWGAGGTADTSEEVVLPEFNMPFVTNLAKGIKKRAGFFTEEFSQKEKKEFFAKLFKHEPWSALSSKRKKETLSTPGGYTRSVSVSKHTSIFIINHQGKKFSNAENDILKRFAKVFEQTYIRFLDLQKAEAQARESQIEAAMEKVRSSSLAMHHSKEMQRVVNTVIDQLQKLNIVLDTTNILIFNNKDKLTEFWTGSNSTGKQLSTSWQVPYFNISYYKAIRMAHEKGQEIFSVSYSFKEKNRLFTHLFTHSDFDKLNEDRKKFILKSPRATIAAAIVKDTAIQIISYSRNSFSTEEIEILKRFSRVFNQAYTRFLDLQKAEAQAREAQIQLALERVRARTMAMQKSEELSEAVYILFQQFRELGENPDQTTIGLINEKDWVIEYWVTMYGNQMEKVFKFPIDEPNVTNKIYKAWKAKKKSLVIDLSGKELYAFTHYREKMGGAKYNPDEKRRVFNVAFFSKGLLIVQSNEVCSEESIYLLERFAAVFEQTYTRFLDLQKAEAQAREAQIEAALERVRASSMAMHQSNDLHEVIKVVAD